MRRVLRGIGTTALVAVVGVSSCVAVRSRDLPAPRDADLLLPVVDVAPELNGRVHLETLIAALDVPVDEDFDAHLTRILLEDEEPQARVAVVLEANRGVLDGVPRVLAAPSFQYAERSLDEMGTIRYLLLAKLLAVQAYEHARNGRAHATLEISLGAIALGHRVQNAERGVLIDMMIGVRMSSLGSAGLRRSLPLLEISAAEARRAADALSAYRSDPDGWSRMWSFEYRFAKDLLRSAIAESAANPPGFSLNPLYFLPDAYTFQLNRTQDAFATQHRGYQRDSSFPCARLKPATPAPSGLEPLVTVLDRNGVGSIVLQISAPSIRRFQHRRCLNDTHLAATATLLGLRAHRLDHRELAESLDELVPTYLSSQPLDGFDGEPLRYSKAARRLHSRGSDGVDRGGEDDSSKRLDENRSAREPTYFVRF